MCVCVIVCISVYSVCIDLLFPLFYRMEESVLGLFCQRPQNNWLNGKMLLKCNMYSLCGIHTVVCAVIIIRGFVGCIIKLLIP